MSTITMNVSLDDELKSLVDSRISKRGFSSVSEYVRDLMRRDLQSAEQERFVALIDEGLQSKLLPSDFDVGAHMSQRIQKNTSARLNKQ
jgi:antitoxin ParD1/3/4